jgi:general secretion pathway protein F
MNERRSPRMAPPASVEQRQERPRPSTASPRPIRPAKRPQASSGWRERVARAWARHPLVAMARHRKRLSFFVGLHTLLRSGVSLSTAFTELSRGAATDPFRRAVADVGAAIVNGSGLAEAMRRQPRWFEAQVVAALEAGELSGTLETALAGIIKRMEEMQGLRWRTLAMSLYPLYLLIAFIVGSSALDAAAKGVRSGGDPGDLITGAVISAITRLFEAAVFGLAIAASPLALAALGLEERWARLRLRLPLLGSFHRRFQASRFCEALGTSLGAGLDAPRSLQMALEATGNADLQARSGEAIQRLRDGGTFTEVVEWLGVVDGESLRQLSIGERAGRIEPLLQQQARQNAEAALSGLRTLVFVLIIAVVVYLFATNIMGIFQFQSDYFRRIEELSHG